MTFTRDDSEQLGEQLNGVAAAAAAAMTDSPTPSSRRSLVVASATKLTPQTLSCLLVLYCFQQAYKYLSNFIHHQVIERKNN